MPLKLKKKQITVEVSELTIELDEVLTKFVTDAAKSENVEPDAYVLGLIQGDFLGRDLPSSSESDDVSESGVSETVGNTMDGDIRTPRRVSKPKYTGKLSELLAFDDEGNDIALELKNKGLITPEQYEFVLSGEIPKGKAAAINQDAQNYIVEQLTKAEGGEIGDGKTK